MLLPRDVKGQKFLFSTVALFILSIFIFSSLGFAEEGELGRIRKAIGGKRARWSAEETSVSKLPLEQKRKRVGLIKPTAQESQNDEELLTASAPISLAAPVGSFDWRSNGMNYVTPVKDQKACGSCWAFATTAALESQVAIATGGVNKDLAEQTLVSCSGAGSCNGGYIDRASNYISASGSGLPTENCFNYTAANTSCGYMCSDWQKSTDAIMSWHWVTYTTPTVSILKDALFTYGPLVTTMDVYEDFYYYHQGIYSYTSGTYQGGHAVLLVGYDDSAQCFLVKNSWGTGWGEAGYFKISYNELKSLTHFGFYTIAYEGYYQPTPPPAAPAAPSDLSATAFSSTQINLSWTDNSSNESGFKIERCTGSGCTSFSQITTVGAGVKTYNNSGLAGGESYTYRVRAYNSGGNSDYSKTATALTPAVLTGPAAPSGLSATASSSTQINLSWVDNSSNESGFKIERCTGSGCTSFSQIATVGAGVKTYNNSGLAGGASYTYRVCAYNSSGNSKYSDAATAATPAVPTGPAAPSGLSATAFSSTQINLSWTDNSSNESGFKIERCKGSGCTSFSQIATLGAGVRTYNNSGLAGGASYTYRVRAYNSSGNSNYSNTATAETPAAIRPVAPTGLSAAASSSTQIDLSWADNSNNETGFKIERCTGSTCTYFRQIATVGPNINTFSNTGLSKYSVYRYRVRSYNSYGNSAYSNIIIKQPLQ
ncbi:C1 family peptidase [Desulforhabdus sp. TSK]|uniref:C1 family peptidase n=1 Tax=Desulforhabdus sp. TSK TaxID=2925014 RepID=UPI001FC7D6A6|nr:C1 family peptidase [Desulforhabdus sp. TSK]GKT07291.1 hypothetical protein DSTSK_05960 [Desulforhabdus sp. TSK]